MLNFKSLKVFACTIALCVAGLMTSAQNTKEINHDFSSFNAINVDNDFTVSLEKSKKNYSISVTVDAVLKEYVQTYVKNHTLYIELDQKSIPSDVKKLYKGKNSPAPTLKAVVSTPEYVTDVTMSGASVLTVDEEIECNEFTLTLKESAEARHLAIDAGTITVNAESKATAELKLYADNLNINTLGNSKLEIESESEIVNVKNGGNAEVKFDGKAVTANIEAAGSSKTILLGQTGDLNITGTNASNVDAINFRTANATVKLNNMSKVTEAATDKLSVELSGNSTLIFDCEPVVNIVNIKSSTMTRYENSKK